MNTTVLSKAVLLFALAFGMLGFGSHVMAQGGAEVVHLDASNNGQTKTLPADGLYIYPEMNADGTYNDNAAVNYTYTICATCTSPNVLTLKFEKFDVHPSDTIFIYDGNSVNAVLLKASNNNNQSLLYANVSTSSLNTSGCLTIRWKTDGGHTNGSPGWQIQVGCSFPCETIVPTIDSMYFKVRDGVVVDTGYTRLTHVNDSTLHVDDSTGDSTWTYTSETFMGVELCVGEDVIFNGHGTYTSDHGYYHPIDATTTFRWDFGNGDTLSALNAKQAYAHYKSLDCYDVSLRLKDEQGCPSYIAPTVRVRLAQNPIKTIYDLATICNSDSLLVNVGYEGENGTITLKKISFEKLKSRSIDCKTFVPDGPNCDEQCYVAPITFDDFPSGRAVSSAEDICSICVNYEHEFMGDYTLAIICPTGAKSYLKYKNNPGGYPDGSYGGGSIFTGYPYGGNSHHSYDGGATTEGYCDSVNNMYGVGFDYCFSRNSGYTLVDGTTADNATDGDHYLGNSAYLDPVTYTFQTIPAPFHNAGQSAGECTFNFKHPSDHTGKFDYYKPADDFHELIGCPLNGTWNIEICDTWGSDNGWIFAWSMDICGISSGMGCEYQVGLDSVVWRPDSAYGDFTLGQWRGVYINDRDSTNSYISTPDTAGTFPIHVTLYDEFNCVWDTLTRITTIWTPETELGPDTVLCDVENMLLDAKDRHTPTNNYSYMWEPFGEVTDTISTHTSVGQSTLYTVEVTNEMSSIRCRARDSIRINVNHQPSPNFDPGIYPLEGCEPFTINITNTSQYADYFRWEFGDGDTSILENPSHTYGTGRYGFKFYVSTEGGCRDSLVYDDLITVYSSPVAKFSWEPVNPTVLHPQVHFINRTEPQSSENMYYWEIQYDRDNDVSYHTLTDVNPDFEWYTDGEDISGTYVARLIAKTNNLGPSGSVIECRDTIENKILLVNDFLQFPNVVTANGDGVNDRFVIGNLVDGMGYPNNTLAIYDRWGKRVYYKENITKDEDFWDPAADNIPTGTYFWRFTGKGYLGNIQRNGSVEVLK